MHLRVLMALWLLAFAAASTVLAAPRVEGPMPAQEGEMCIVSCGRTHAGDVAYLVDGQRFAVAKALEQQFLTNPMEYIKLNQGRMPHDTASAAGPDWRLFSGVFAAFAILALGFWLHSRRNRPELPTVGGDQGGR